MTNDASLTICHHCYVSECEAIEDTTARELRGMVKRGEAVDFPQCPLVRAFVFNHHHTTAGWCKQFAEDDQRVPKWLRRLTDQMIDRYSTFTTE